MQMTSENIKAATERAAQTGKRVEATDDGHAGLELGISPHGVQTWSLRVRDPSGRLRRFRLGDYPDLSVSLARKAARAERAKVEAGHDPLAERRAKREVGAALRAGIGTLRAVIDRYEHQGSPPATWFTGVGRRRVERVFGNLMSQPVAAMKASDIMRVADAYPGTRLSAQNAIRSLRPVLTWSARRDYVPAGLSMITPGEGVPTRDRVLTADELTRVLPVFRAGKPTHASAMLFMLLTLARREEAAGAQWSEIDLERATWTIPPERQKNTRRDRMRIPLVVPLSHQARALLRRLTPENAEPKSAGLVFAAKRGGRLINWDRAQKDIFKASSTVGWHRHDLRRTGATMMGEAGIAPHVIEAALNHATIHSQLAGRYNTSRYREDVKEALDTLSRLIIKISLVWREQPDEHGEPELVQVLP